MNNIYKLEKNYWTEKDFAAMGWHDSRIHGISFNSNNESLKSDLLFDIDYIFKWVNQTDKYFTFWISPCTLIFHDVLKLKINLDSEDYLATELDISELRMSPILSSSKSQLYQIELETNFGDILFETSGYEQFVRITPKHSDGQWLDLDERGGISYEKIKC